MNDDRLIAAADRSAEVNREADEDCSHCYTGGESAKSYLFTRRSGMQVFHCHLCDTNIEYEPD